MFKDKELIVPMVTPFFNDETINYKELGKITNDITRNGADGIFAVGSSAECFLLDMDERKKTLETIIKNANGKKVIAHVGALGTKKSIELARHAQNSGADMIGSVPPFYFNFTYENVRDYYWELADSTSLPVMIYYMPNSTNISLGVEQMVNIINGRKNITSLKYTDNNYNIMQSIKNATSIKVYSGRDECFLSATVAGTDGAIGTTFNFMLDSFRNILALLDEGDILSAEKEQTKICLLIDTMLKGDIFHSTKLIMKNKGYDIDIARKPFHSLTFNQSQDIINLYNKLFNK